MVVLGGLAVSYERGTPVHETREWASWPPISSANAYNLHTLFQLKILHVYFHVTDKDRSAK